MKKHISLFLALLLILAVALPLPASAAFGFIYDETEQMDCPELEALYFSLYDFGERTGIQTELYLFTYEEGLVLSELAQALYEDDDSEKDGYISLILQVHPDSDGWYLDENDPWYIYTDDNFRTLCPEASILAADLASCLSGSCWNGTLEEDRKAFCNIAEQYLNSLSRIVDSPLPDDTHHIIDEAALLNASERMELDMIAAQISEAYGCGIYIMTVDDFRDYGYGNDVFTTTWNIYHDRSLGWGNERQGMILLLSMDDRDFATFFYGKDVEHAFDAYGQEALEEHFLDNFASNDWYGGFLDYLNTSEKFLSSAAEGDPVRESKAGMYAVVILISCVISLIVTLVIRSQMNNAKLQHNAASYIAADGLQLTHRNDRFLHITRTRRKIQTSSDSSGSRSHSGGGGSGRSGKF